MAIKIKPAGKQRITAAVKGIPAGNTSVVTMYVVPQRMGANAVINVQSTVLIVFTSTNTQKIFIFKLRYINSGMELS
jgi:uncharacterized protein YbjQ (UPF0145 family)